MLKTMKKHSKSFYESERRDRNSKIAYNMAKKKVIEMDFEQDGLAGWTEPDTGLGNNDFKSVDDSGNINR